MSQYNLSGHYSQRYDAELERLVNLVLEMGGMVEMQVKDAVRAFTQGDERLAAQVRDNDVRVNSYEVSIDELGVEILAKRQPQAGDLRLVVSVMKTIADLERIGDLSERIAKFTGRQAFRGKRSMRDVELMGELCSNMLHAALNALARMDAKAALEAVKLDQPIDDAYEAIMRQNITFLLEDARNISPFLDMLWTVRALERIGDHARNICEYTIFFVKGRDIRHVDLKTVERVVNDMHDADAAGGDATPDEG
ncbi:MAG: phosphate signaling complex protein PhoU [Thioalkalivibrionaceae bacterium]